jgi:two-component system, cell cycle sensor histidine kinase and response regulator CckA
MDRRVRVLYAEDNASDADLTRRHFATNATDIQLDIVEYGEACLTRLQNNHYDVLLLDYRLPDMDAIDVLKALAIHNVYLPVIVATAVGDEDLVVRVLRLGAWDYVPKQGNYIGNLPSLIRQAAAEYRGLRDVGYAARRSRRRILYIECSEADIDLTAGYMAEHAPHLQLDIVRSATEGLELLQRTLVDLVLVDLRMPDMHALDFLRQLRQRGQSVPVVVVTGGGDETAAIAALKLGAYDYICKREGYLTQVPYAIDNAIDRFRLMQLNRRLEAELADRERAEAERAHLSEQLQQAQKIESLGRLAGGVAHDFNNLLTVITGHADLMLEKLAPDDPLRENVRNVSAATRRASDLTRQLLAFGRRQLLQPRVMDLNESIRESTSMVSRLLNESVELVTVLDPHLGHVEADPSQLNQLLVNLAVNARDAMPHGGRLTIETDNVSIDDEEAQRHPSFRPGSYVMLAVSDTGIGIQNDVLPHIFEPFFTTKEHGKGTGLGLSMVYGIVKQSGGWIWVSSEVGRGTTFKVYLPRVEGALSVIGAPAALDSPRGDETVLVVEDQQEVRSLMLHVLRTHGYDVIEAAEGASAVAACEAVARPISLLVTDVVMPGMSGPTLAAHLRTVRPDMRVLYVSGYTDAAVFEHGTGEQPVTFLQKPFTPSQLTRKVREVLDAPSTRNDRSR